MMKNFNGVLVATVIFLGLAGSGGAAAQEAKAGAGDDVAKTDVKMMEPAESGGHRWKGPQKMCPLMKSMMNREVVATSDGGVVVLLGNKLIKYDKDLNILKEVEIKVDLEAMRKSMMEMMKDMPPMKGKMAGDVEEEEGLGQKE